MSIQQKSVSAAGTGMPSADVLVIGGGAAGLMAAARAAAAHVRVTVLEKMPRPGRKIMITGKGRCNFTNVKAWEAFSPHVHGRINLLRPAFYHFPPDAVLSYMEEAGVPVVVERGDRAFPVSHMAVDIVDALVRQAVRAGVRLECGCEVASAEAVGNGFRVQLRDGRTFSCRKLIVATGGLSYPGTGSTGDGYRLASAFGHAVRPCFPSLTALVPRGYKVSEGASDGLPGHIDRSRMLAPLGKCLCGVHLRNVSLTLLEGERVLEEAFGELEFTDGGLEGPIGFSVSRTCVQGLVQGRKMAVSLDLKPAVETDRLQERIEAMVSELRADKRNAHATAAGLLGVLLVKLMPRELVPGFHQCHPDLLCGQGRQAHIQVGNLAKALKHWHLPIDGFVGYERAVVTAGGIPAEEIIPKTLESRRQKGLYFCGEVLDLDADTGGYNLQMAFCTGSLAGESAARACLLGDDPGSE